MKLKPSSTDETPVRHGVRIKGKKAMACAILLMTSALFTRPAMCGIVLSISAASPSSTTITGTWSGSITATSAIPSKTFSQIGVPYSSQSQWFSVGELDTVSIDLIPDAQILKLATGNITYQKNAEAPQSVAMSVIQITADGVLKPTHSSFTYPSLEVSDVITYGGSFTFDLTSGNFGTRFTQGTASLTGFGESGTMDVSAVPEPSAFLCLGLVGMGLGAWRKLKTATEDA